ncbi:ras GEF [Pseudovirgaria hyperparasitica]|uniref:Class E vacuolar protein-sorting machinery protein HSE1 n=1 Tax=Pseudovirgaria hyperparasitica TaxID=470096 RepID=A0A6A6WKZ8_9PEZI|nr:ras GEF [Pseudovirgaria hyperparasitica]KAF2762857.1 ras GEF [Pseudovirgaria hyperparasitica]
MNGYSGNMAPPGGMFVRALYDYEADDRTSLSFRQGDIIQVITQLESGWWDGVINGTRGWFPSNYCAVVPRPNESDLNERYADLDDDPSAIGEGDYPTDTDSEADNDITHLPIEGRPSGRDQEEAAFWIPQATPDGRLFYFNTLTGESTMELPLENPSSLNENGPRDRTNIYVPEQTRPPPELMAGGLNIDDTDDENSNSDIEGHSAMGGSYSSLPHRRRSFQSDGISPAPSMDSLHAAARSRDMIDGSFSAIHGTLPPNGTAMTSFSHGPFGSQATNNASRQFFEEAAAVPLTWNKMMDEMKKAISRYREAINNSDRSEFVKRAEDISDHLRLLLAAGSGTTDNHSGNLSIISTNKALYPHFRETMSRFSKLVLSSHIAAADWPPPDSFTKCLKEAEGVLNGVYAFVEVARQQRGENLPRIVPGFVLGTHSGGNWRTNGIGDRDPTSSSFMDQDSEFDSFNDSSNRLDTRLLQQLGSVRSMISQSIRRLADQLVVRSKTIKPLEHEVLGNNICSAAGKVLDVYRPWISTIESINLSPIASSAFSQQLSEFGNQKQRIYDLVSELVIVCQAVAAPLADEWSEVRNDTIEDRVDTVRNVTRELDSTTASFFALLLQLVSTVPEEDNLHRPDPRRNTDSELPVRDRSDSFPKRPTLPHSAKSHAGVPGAEPAPMKNPGSNPAKVMKFFGEVPAPVMTTPVQDEVPAFLRLDHEGEISYDTKVTPPQLRGGTLTALVEQLTRHDRLDSPFNNTFLLTYQSFTTASELFEMLVKRWSIQPPEGLAQEDYQTWVDKKQKPIRFRVVNILKSWFDTYWMEGYDDDARVLIQRVYNFAKDHVAKTSTPGAGPLIAAVEQRLRGQDAPSKRMVLTMSTQTPPPILPKHMRKLKFLDIDPLEFARQLTIIESRLYGKVKPAECLNKIWHTKKTDDGEPKTAVNVHALILHSNRLTNWVAQMILTQQDVKKRVVVIKHFVNVAEKCRTLNNFSTVTSILCALSTAPVHRLTRTWNAVNARTMTTLEGIKRLISSTKNFAEYRETLHKANPPCIPFFGVYLTDLTFIEDGIPSLIKKTNLINFAKRAKTAEVIRDIQQYQNVQYSLAPVPELQEYILSNMQSAGDVHEMYEMSLQVEPREREDEKIARYVLGSRISGMIGPT